MPTVQPPRRMHTPEEIAVAVKKLRAHHEMGTESLESNPERVPYKTSSELLRKARSVATAFDKADLESLIELSLENGFALPRTHLDRLATVQDKRSRMALARRATRERWSRPTLDAVIRKRFGSGHRYLKLGRLPRQPHDEADAYAEWLRLALRVVRYGEMLGWEHSKAKRTTPAGEITLRELPAVQKEAKVALQACMKLMEAAQDALGHEVAER